MNGLWEKMWLLTSWNSAKILQYRVYFFLPSELESQVLCGTELYIDVCSNVCRDGEKLLKIRRKRKNLTLIGHA